MANQVLSLEQYKCESVIRPALSNVTLPEATDTYQPIGHDYLVDVTEDCLREIGFRFGSQHHGLSHDGARYFGVVELLSENPNSDYSLTVGLRNSLDKRFPAGVAFGAVVFVCANLCFGGEQVIGRKHTVNIMRDLPNLIYAAVGGLKSMQHNQDRRFEVYQQSKLGDTMADHLIVEMLRRNVINTQRVQKVVQEWDEPSYDHGGRTVWRLFNAVTESLKGCNIQEMPQRTIPLQMLLDEQVGFIPLAA